MNNTNQETEVEEMPEKPTNTTAESASQEPPMRKGLILKNTRIEKGFSLEAVHETTKIPMDALKAIEEGYTIRTLSPFYIKGFLKIYANYLNIDVTEVIDDYQREELPEVVKQEVIPEYEFDFKKTVNKYLTPQRQKQLLALLGIFLALFLFFKFLVFLTQSFKNREKKPAKVEQNAPKINQPANTNTNSPQQTKPVVEKPKVEIVKPKPKPKPAPQVQTPPPAPVPVVKPVQKEVTLTVRAKKDSWLRVKADDKTVFQSTLNKGSVETWQADKNIVLKGKNIIHLEFELNGKMIGTLGRRNRKAKSVTFTKEGLSVTK